MDTRRTLAHGVALATIVVWGTTFIATKLLLAAFSPIEILVIRFTMGYLGLVVYERISTAGRHRDAVRWDTRQELLFAGAGLTGIVMYYLLENHALTLTFASNVGILVSIAPLTTALLAPFFLKEEPVKVNIVVGFVIASAGVALVMFNGTVELRLSLAGDLLALASTIGWAIYSIILKKIDTVRYKVSTYTKKIFLYGIVFMLPFAATGDFSLGNLGLLMFLGLGASAACFVSWNHAVHVLGVFRTSAYIYLTPLVSLFTASLVLGESITPMAIGGCLLILVGLYLSERKPLFVRKAKPAIAESSNL